MERVIGDAEFFFVEPDEFKVRRDIERFPPGTLMANTGEPVRMYHRGNCLPSLSSM